MRKLFRNVKFNENKIFEGNLVHENIIDVSKKVCDKVRI